jgi:hypothetical protein
MKKKLKEKNNMIGTMIKVTIIQNHNLVYLKIQKIKNHLLNYLILKIKLKNKLKNKLRNKLRKKKKNRYNQVIFSLV